MENNIHEDFLKLVGFEGDEVQEYLPRWRAAAEKLGLTDDDVRFSTEEWLPENWDMDLRGVRKAVGAYIRELVDITRTTEYQKNGVKIVYGIMPATVTNYLAIKESAGDKVYVSFPDLHLARLNSFFHKLDPYLEKAEQEGCIVYGCRHCALNKTRLAARMKSVIASPDIIWSWGFNCDEGPKMDEYINCFYDAKWEYEVTRLPHDTHFGEVDDENEERVKYIARSLKYSCDRVQNVIGVQITPETLSKAVKSWRAYALKVGWLQSMVFSADPVPLSGHIVNIMSAPLSSPFNTGYQYWNEALDILTAEVKERVNKRIGVTPKGAPKVGCYFVPVGVPWINKIFRENGVGLTFSMVLTLSKRQLKLPSYQDPYMAAAENLLRTPIVMNMGLEVEETVEKVEKYKPDAMVMGFFDFDRWMGAHHKMMSRLVEERTKVPHFYLEADFWEDRDYSLEALRTRIESICQVVKMRKQ